MRGMTSSLSTERIFALSTSLPDHITIEVVAETGSTNADLLTLIQKTQGSQNGPSGLIAHHNGDAITGPMLLIAEQQTAGRGRAGRTWLSAPSAALMFSLAWRFDRPLQKLIGLPLAVGVAIADGLNQYLKQTLSAVPEQENAETDFGIRLKWPNDLLLVDGESDGKLGGILIETASGSAQPNGYADRSTWAVIGVGINLAIPVDIQQQLDRKVANLPRLGPDSFPVEPDRNLLMATLLSSLTRALQQFQSDGLNRFVTRWNQLHAHAGQQVVILDQGKVLHEGTALGIDEIGRFLLQTAQDDAPMAIMAGDISLRVKET